LCTKENGCRTDLEISFEAGNQIDRPGHCLKDIDEPRMCGLRAQVDVELVAQLVAARSLLTENILPGGLALARGGSGQRRSGQGILIGVDIEKPKQAVGHATRRGLDIPYEAGSEIRVLSIGYDAHGCDVVLERSKGYAIERVARRVWWITTDPPRTASRHK